MSEEADRKFVVDTLDRHRLWYDNEARPEHLRHWRSFDDDAWGMKHGADSAVWGVIGDSVTAAQDEGPTTGTLHPTEVNLARPYVNSHMASLYYEGIVVEVSADEFAKPGETEAARARRAAGVEALANKWLATPEVIDVSERVIQMSLMYRGGTAYKVYQDPDAKEPLAAVKLRAVPPWELVVDRRTPTQHGLRYIGHLRQEPIEYVARLRGEPLDPEWLKGAAGLCDVVEEGFVQAAQFAEDQSYLWVFTVDNLVGQVELSGDGDERFTIPGERSEFLVDAVGNGQVYLLRRGPSPYEEDGKPVSELVPFIAEPVPHRPWDSIAPLASTYTTNAELNGALSVVAGQFRKDAPRRILTTDELDEESRAKLQHAADGEFVKVPSPTEGAGRLSDRYHVLNLGDVPDSTLQYVAFLRDNLQRTESMSDLARGKGGEYMRAETARSLVAYDEATIGRIRKRSDVAVSTVVKRMFQATADAMTRLKVKSIKVTIEIPAEDGTTATSTYDVTADDLTRCWNVQVIDSASKPGGGADELATIQAVIPTMMELAAAADPPDPTTGLPSPTQQAFARSMFDHLATKANLPPGMRFAALKATAPEQEELEVEEPEEVAPPMPPPVEAVPPQGAPVPPPVPGGLAEGIVTAAEAGM